MLPTMSRLSRPPYIDAATGVAYDTDKAEFEGYLTKQSMWLRVRSLHYWPGFTRQSRISWNFVKEFRHSDSKITPLAVDILIHR